MNPLVLVAAMAIRLGPMGPDAPAREPQIAANPSTTVLVYRRRSRYLLQFVP